MVAAIRQPGTFALGYEGEEAAHLNDLGRTIALSHAPKSSHYAVGSHLRGHSHGLNSG